MEKKNAPIGVFDSGVGGISVLRELVRLMPKEDFVYFGDSKRAPYGTKTLEEVRDYTIESVEFLMEKGCKGITVACNTATSAAVAILRKKYPELPLVGIEPAIKPAVLEHPDSKIVVMATPMTLRNEKFQKLMNRYKEQARICPLPCPGLVEYIERGDLDGEDLRAYLADLLQNAGEEEISAIVLGCTHYPFAKNMIQQVVGEKVCIYDGGAGTAREMRRRLKVCGLLTDRDISGSVSFYNSRNTDEEKEFCKWLLNLPY